MAGSVVTDEGVLGVPLKCVTYANYLFISIVYHLTKKISYSEKKLSYERTYVILYFTILKLSGKYDYYNNSTTTDYFKA